MKERPILFSAPMVRAILEGRKTQTRRVVKLRHGADVVVVNGQVWKPARVDYAGYVDCPYGQPGDRLWVRETWNWFDPVAIPQCRAGIRAPFTGISGEREIPWVTAYAADGPLPYPGYEGKEHWRPSIHMPRWASRILLEIVSVRVERLKDISDEDAMAEGMAWDDSVYDFSRLWESINGPGSWEANPWVWVIEFRRVQP